MGQGFSLNDDNMDEIYKLTTDKVGSSRSVTQGKWTIIIKKCGVAPSLKHMIYSMTAKIGDKQIGKVVEFTQSDQISDSDKANLKKKIDQRINDISLKL